MKKRSKIILLICLIPIVGYLGYIGYLWYSYASTLEKQEESWYREEFIPLSINGIVSTIEGDEEQPFFITLQIKTKSESLSYGLCVNQERDFKEFISPGDSVVKRPGNPMVTFIKKDGRQKAFHLPFCNSFF